MIVENTGAYVGPEKWVAQPLTPPHTLSVNGVRLGLLVLTEKAELQVQLREDWHGLPLGKSMVDVILRTGKIGQKHWANLLFSAPVELFVQPYWLLCRATGGAAIWLAQTSDSSISMLKHENEEQLDLLEGMAALYGWMVPDQTEAIEELHLPSSLKVSNQQVVPVLVEGDTLVYELAGALNSSLQAADTGSGHLTVKLSFTAAVPGFITVYSPEIEYSVND